MSSSGLKDEAVAGGSGLDRMAERKKKLAALHRKRNESRQLNHAEVVEEDRRAKEPKNMEVDFMLGFARVCSIHFIQS